MIRAFSLAFASLSDRAIFAILLGGALGIGISWFVSSWLGDSAGWFASAATIASVIMTILSWWLLFRLIAITVIWFFADDIVEAVEMKHYPVAAVMGRRPGIGASASLAVRSLLRAIGYNALAIPFYLLLLVTGVGAPLVFLLVNALLLGRDLEDMLGFRHGRAHKHMRKSDRLILGAAGTAGMMIPFVNLLVPVIATSMAVHLMHGEDEKTKARI